MNKEKIIDQLLEYFLREDKRFLNNEIPDNIEEKRSFLRGIINLRPPQPLPEKILNLEDELLRLELKKGNYFFT